MARAPRADEAGGLYHALNRANMRATIFKKEADYAAFEEILHTFRWSGSNFERNFWRLISGEVRWRDDVCLGMKYLVDQLAAELYGAAHAREWGLLSWFGMMRYVSA